MFNFGCRHDNYTWPTTLWNWNRTRRLGIYVVCLQCAMEFCYSWSEMRITKPVVRRVKCQ
jgi:hypothetical protein